ncbi:hypothetical protein NLG97_g3764 [Lecanicillium saksenae]|uniref:Uncharacterized protein n=1 Tax=Lecanicillium saksenae TaxID=468837 RepID=A0ACC1QX55_9HYPO|nr:hypothetical protein NLG97_g3764 [Lecanicillium saksenae]
MSSTPRLRVPAKEQEAQKVEDNAARSYEARCPVLLPLHDMPEWFQEESNQWILHSYRPISGSIRASFRSWWYVHNETVNIYTHLIPAVIFLFGEWFILQNLATKYPRITSLDFVAFSSFIVTASICYGISALYHTLANHSYAVDHLCHRLDMLGIGIFIIGDIVLGVYLIFRCETILRNIYWSMIVVLGALTIVTNIHPKLQGHRYRFMRAMAFVATVLSVAAPLIHGLKIFGLDLMNKKAFSYTMVAKLGCLLSGTTVYAMRIPERWWPGKFDMCNSHSFMHMFVVSAAVVQMIGYLEAFDYAYLHITCPIS